MKYAIVAAALAGMAMAIPASEWDNVPKKDDKCEAATKTYTTKECGNDKDKWDNCKDVTKTKVEWPAHCTEWANTPDDKFCKDGKDKYGKPCKKDDKDDKDWSNVDDKKKGWCKGGKDKDGKECHSDDDDWSNWPKGCKWGKDKDGKDCKVDDKDWSPAPVKDDDKKDWKPAPVKDEKCYTTKVYTTKECGNDKDKWDNCKDVTKTKTEYASTCTEWAAVTTTAWTTWAPVDDCKYVTKVYTTKECGADKDKWDNCKDVTKTKTEYPETCKSKAAETWAPYTPEAPKAPAVTSEWNTWKASSTVAAPVAKWTGAADRQSAGIGALAIAMVAALL